MHHQAAVREYDFNKPPSKSFLTTLLTDGFTRLLSEAEINTLYLPYLENYNWIKEFVILSQYYDIAQ